MRTFSSLTLDPSSGGRGKVKHPSHAGRDGDEGEVSGIILKTSGHSCKPCAKGCILVDAMVRGFTLALVVSLWSGLSWGTDAKPATKRVAIFHQDSRLAPRLDMFKEMLRELGHVEGKSVEYDYHLAWPGRDDLDLAAENLVRVGADLIFAVGTPPALAARKAYRCAGQHRQSCYAQPTRCDGARGEGPRRLA